MYNERRERYGDYIVVIIVRRSNYILDISNKDDRWQKQKGRVTNSNKLIHLSRRQQWLII